MLCVKDLKVLNYSKIEYYCFNKLVHVVEGFECCLYSDVGMILVMLASSLFQPDNHIFLVQFLFPELGLTLTLFKVKLSVNKSHDTVLSL